MTYLVCEDAPNSDDVCEIKADSTRDAAERYLKLLRGEGKLEECGYKLWVREARDGAEWEEFCGYAELVLDISVRKVFKD